jgi:hypothetical protein
MRGCPNKSSSFKLSSESLSSGDFGSQDLGTCIVLLSSSSFLWGCAVKRVEELLALLAIREKLEVAAYLVLVEERGFLAIP